MTGYKWHPITDLPEDPRGLTDGELDSLLRVWRSQQDQMIERTALDEFDKRLRREWAIETGIIEGVYTLDRGVTKTLIERGIDAALISHSATNRDSTLVARIIQDHYDALEGMGENINVLDRVLQSVGAYGDYCDIVRLNLNTRTQAKLDLFFRSAGLRFQGFLEVWAYLTTEFADPTLVRTDTFLINYEEDLASATNRFSVWLDRVIVQGLNMWRLTL